MKLEIFTIHDEKADAFITPFFQNNSATATRLFQRMVNDPEHAFAQTPRDFTLYKIGTYDDEGAVIDYCKAIEIVNGSSLKET